MKLDITTKIRNWRTIRLQKKLDKIQRLLHTTPEQRKAENKRTRIAKRVKRIQKLRSFQPFDVKCVRWYQKHLFDVANGKTEVIVHDQVPDGGFGPEAGPAIA